MKDEPYVSASEIGKTAWCPHGASLLARGAKPDARHFERTNRGTASHERLTEEVRATQGRDKRCFVATYALGTNHPTTNRLRAWRDDFLLQHSAGRLFVTGYYLLSPRLIRVLGNNRRVRLICAWAVKKFAHCIGGR